MASAILITGFNNWGKSTLIRDLFGQRRFDFGTIYRISNITADFAVESHSNDDFSEKKYVGLLQRRMNQTPSRDDNLLCAFCPTRETTNDSLQILRRNIFTRFDEIHLFLLVFKWDHHATLMVPDLQTFYRNSGVNLFVVDADAMVIGDEARHAARLQQTVTELRRIFP
ncbi:MAG: hypothetical protein WC556_08665 [Candidatus Methanoperedens sp.]